MPRLDVAANMIHSLGSMEWGSETEEQDKPENASPRFSDESPKKRARVDAADGGDKGSEVLI